MASDAEDDFHTPPTKKQKKAEAEEAAAMAAAEIFGDDDDIVDSLGHALMVGNSAEDQKGEGEEMEADPEQGQQSDHGEQDKTTTPTDDHTLL